MMDVNASTPAAKEEDNKVTEGTPNDNEEAKEADDPPYVIPDKMYNHCEKHFKLDLSPASMMKYVNENINKVGSKGIE